MSQSRHTTLSDGEVSYRLANLKHGYVLKDALSEIMIGETTALDVCRKRFRSSILDDVQRLCVLLGLDPKADVSRLAMKTDGFWSCVWTLTFDRRDTLELCRMGAIAQSRKRGHFSQT